MNRSKALSFFPILLLAALSLTSCSGLPKTCTGTCVIGGNATVSFTLVADTLPANPSILSFKVSIVGIALTPTTGAAVTLTPAAPVVDLMRLQSDTAFLGALTTVPSGSYTVQVTLTSQEITFLNDTTSSITANGTACAVNAVCTATLAAAGTPSVASFTFTATSGGKQGIELDFNLKNAISLTNGTLSVNFNPATPNPGVFTAFTLPRTNTLGANQLELIEDFTGVVSITNQSVTLTAATAAGRGSITALATSGTIYDHDPSGTLCPTPTTQLTSCVSNNQFASMDVILKSDGTFAIQEIEPLLATLQDTVEGIVSSINPSNQTQFTIVVTDIVPLAQSSLIGSLKTGDQLTVNLSNPSPFLVDTKGLNVSSVAPATFAFFSGATNTGALHLGQVVTVHVIAPFTAAAGTTIASAATDKVTLRWSRFTASPTQAGTQSLVVNGLPSIFGSTVTSAGVQLFPGTQGQQGVTNFDGVADGSSVVTGKQAFFRALFIQNPGNSVAIPFFAAKVRQH
jgi:hypothetical protein